MAYSCFIISDFVRKYLIDADFEGLVLDLGSEIGANSIPLALLGCQVTAIEIQDEVMKRHQECENDYRERWGDDHQQFFRTEYIVGDITEVAYPEGVDAIICIDVLPYVPPSKLKKTLKNFQSPSARRKIHRHAVF